MNSAAAGVENGSAPIDARQYRIRSGEPADEVRRVAAGRIDSATEALRRAAAGGRENSRGAEDIHTARKDLKKIRSLIRLVRPVLGNGWYRRENQRYRDAARRLSADRDARIRFEIAIDLLCRHPGEHPAGTESMMTRLEAAQMRPTGPGQSQADVLLGVADAIQAGRDLIPEWPLDGLGQDTFRRSLQRTRARGRQRMLDVETAPTGPHVHEWRKRVKDLWYMARLLHDRWPASGRPPVPATDRLADLLGQHQDLEVLLDWLSRNSDSAAQHLTAMAWLRQEEILGEAIPSGHRIYA